MAGLPIEVIKNINLFNGLTDKELSEVGKLCRESNCKAGEMCLTEGDHIDTIRFVKRGKVIIEFHAPRLFQNSEVVVDTISDGEIFAWSALVTSTLTASVKASEETEVIEINADELNALCEKKPRIGYVIMKNLTQVINSRLAKSRKQLLSAIEAIGE